MFRLSLVDPSPSYPEYDYQTWYLLPWLGTAVPGSRHLGEWIWIGRDY